MPSRIASAPPARLLASFITHFKRAIQMEMDAMRERRGSFEIAITDGVRDDIEGSQNGVRATYRVVTPDEKLVAGMECTLRTSAAEWLVAVERVDGADITLSSDRPIDNGDGHGVLVIYPWFLYEKLLAVLD